MALPFLRQLIFQTLTDPRAAARRVLSFGISYSSGLALAALLAVLSVLVAVAAQALVGGRAEGVSALLLSQPLLTAGLQLGLTVGLAGAAVVIGGWFGGSGSQEAGLAVFVLFQGMMLVIQIVQLVLVLALPPVAALISLLALFWAPWALASFITELHRFQSVLKVLGGTFISFLGILFVVALLLTMAGVQPPGAG